MFKLIGVLLLLYTLYAGWRGEVYARQGASGALVTREESPRYFWVVIVIYTGLAVALMTVF